MIKKKLMLTLLVIFSFSQISYSSSDLTVSKCIEDVFCPVAVAFGVVLLGISVSNDYNNYIALQNEKKGTCSSLRVNIHNLTVKNFDLIFKDLKFVYPVCLLNQTDKKSCKVPNQKTKQELAFLQKQNWDKLSPAAKKNYKKFKKYN